MDDDIIPPGDPFPSQARLRRRPRHERGGQNERNSQNERDERNGLGRAKARLLAALPSRATSSRCAGASIIGGVLLQRLTRPVSRPRRVSTIAAVAASATAKVGALEDERSRAATAERRWAATEQRWKGDGTCSEAHLAEAAHASAEAARASAAAARAASAAEAREVAARVGGGAARGEEVVARARARVRASARGVEGYSHA